MGYKVIKFEFDGIVSYGICASTQYIILNWGNWADLCDEDKVEKPVFSSEEVKNELLEGCGPDSFFAVPTEEDAEKCIECLN